MHAAPTVPTAAGGLLAKTLGKAPGPLRRSQGRQEWKGRAEGGAAGRGHRPSRGAVVPRLERPPPSPPRPLLAAALRGARQARRTSLNYRRRGRAGGARHARLGPPNAEQPVDQRFVPGRGRTRPCARLPPCRPVRAPDQKWHFLCQALAARGWIRLGSLPRDEADVLQAETTCARSGDDPAAGLDRRFDQPTSPPFLAPYGGDLLLLFALDSARTVPGGVDPDTGVCWGVDSLASDTLRRYY